VAIAITHIILAAENECVATRWLTGYNPLLLREALNTRENELIFGITPICYKKKGFMKSTMKERKPLEEIIEYL
jgi:nitroreductase